MNLKNKKILITGATGGIGNSLIKKFNDLGSSIIATGTNEEKLNNLKEKYPNIYVEKFKLEEHNKIEKFIDTIYAKLNGLDLNMHEEEIAIEMFSNNIISAGQQFLDNPNQNPLITNWNRVQTAVPEIKQQLLDIVESDSHI